MSYSDIPQEDGSFRDQPSAELDLTHETPSGLSTPRLGPEIEFREKVRIFRREVVRLLIVLLLFLAFLITLIWAFISAGGAHWSNVKDLLDLILPAETALLGTAIAFYMTDSRGSDDDRDKR